MEKLRNNHPSVPCMEIMFPASMVAWYGHVGKTHYYVQNLQNFIAGSLIVMLYLSKETLEEGGRGTAGLRSRRCGSGHLSDPEATPEVPDAWESGSASESYGRSLSVIKLPSNTSRDQSPKVSRELAWLTYQH